MQIYILFCIVATTLAQDKSKFIVVGNWGDDNSDKARVAEAMGEWAESNTVDFIVSTGDNFYPDGVTSPDDPQLDETWKNAYTHPAIADLPWYISLGNRDHDDDLREWNQVYYSAGQLRFTLPQLTYSFVAEARLSTIQFVIIDTQSIRHDKNDKAYMLQFLDEKLSNTEADWKIVIGHHPAYSVGGASGSSSIRDEVDPILVDNKVDFYLSGHDHNMQHMQRSEETDVDYIQSGSGGRSLYSLSDERLEAEEARGLALRNFSYSFGFVYFEVDEKRTRVTFVSDSGDELYFYERES